MRRVLSIPLVLIGIVGIAFGSLLWWVDQQLFDTSSVVEHTPEILAKPAIQAELRSAILDKEILVVGSANDKLKSQIDKLVKDELADPIFQKDFSDSVAATHQSLLDPTTATIRLDLSAVAVHLATKLEPTNPAAAQAITTNSDKLRLDLFTRSQLPRQWQWAQRWHGFGPLYFGLGTILVAIGVAVGPGRWALLVTTGVGLVVLCIATVLATKWAVAAGVAHTASTTDKAAIKDLAQPFVADLTTQSVVVGVIGLLVALVGAGLGVMGVGRVPKSEWSPPSSFRQANWR